MVALPSTRRLGKSEHFMRFSQMLAGKKKKKKKKKPMLEENQNRENSQVTESGCVISRHAKKANVDIYQCGEKDLILSE